MTLGNLDRARKGNRGRSLDASWHRVSDPVASPASATEDGGTLVSIGGGGSGIEIRRNGSRQVDGKKSRDRGR